jgi:tetratricopeptide (TPR) repeat protein
LLRADEACPDPDPAALWSEADRERVQHEFASPAAWTALDHAMTGYADAWARERHDACAATRVRGDQSDARMDRRMQCFARAQRTARSLVDALAQADDENLLRASEAAAGLPSLRRCSDPAYLDAAAEPPADEDTQLAVERLQAALDEGHAKGLAGEFEVAVQIREDVLRDAETLGYAPLVALSRYALGNALQRAGRFSDAEAHLQASYFEALACGELPTAFDAAADLTWLYGEARGDIERAENWYLHGDALWRQLGLSAIERAALVENYASALHRAGRFDDSIARHHEALAMLDETDEHEPLQRMIMHNNLGNAYEESGEIEAALAQHRRALELGTQAMGDAHPLVAGAHSNLGNALLGARRLDEAQHHVERALEIRRGTLPPNHPDLGASLNNLGSIHYEAGAFDRALPLYGEARGVFEAAFGREHAWVAIALENVGNTHLQLGHLEDAEREIEASLAIRRALFGEQGVQTASGLRWLGRAREAAGRHAEAVELLTRALVGYAGAQSDPYDAAEVRFDLARALGRLPERRAEAVTHAVAAHGAFVAAGPRGRMRADEVASWLVETTAASR